MVLYLFWHLVVRWINRVICHLKFILNLTVMLILALFFTWRLTYSILRLLGRSQIDLVCSFCFGVTVGSMCQYVLKQVLQRHMSPGTLQGDMALADFAAGVSMVFILQAGDWARVSTLARHFFQHISLLQVSIVIPCSMLSLALVTSQLVVKCQTLSYVKSCWYVGLLDLPGLSK